jgi:hypothetical protein
LLNATSGWATSISISDLAEGFPSLNTDLGGAMVIQSAEQTGSAGSRSTVVLMFESEGAPAFNATVSGLLALNTPTVAETGTWQDLSGILNSGPLEIQVQSDYTSKGQPDFTIGSVADAAASTGLGFVGVGILMISMFYAMNIKWTFISPPIRR